MMGSAEVRRWLKTKGRGGFGPKPYRGDPPLPLVS